MSRLDTWVSYGSIGAKTYVSLLRCDLTDVDPRTSLK